MANTFEIGHLIVNLLKVLIQIIEFYATRVVFRE